MKIFTQNGGEYVSHEQFTDGKPVPLLTMGERITDPELLRYINTLPTLYEALQAQAKEDKTA